MNGLQEKREYGTIYQQVTQRVVDVLIEIFRSIRENPKRVRKLEFAHV
jgi:hypothetical protein